MSREVRTVAPTASVVALDQAKAHLNITHDADDLLIYQLIENATSVAERYYGRVFLTQTWECYLDCFPGTGYAITDVRPCPISSFTSLEYMSSGSYVALDSADYVAKIQGEQPGEIEMASYAAWPTADSTPQAVKLTYVCGYGDDPQDVPAVYRTAVLLIVGELYENRELNIVGASMTQNTVLKRLLDANMCISL
jgi:uncharacterized phiE125 gp8 family phage protein